MLLREIFGHNSRLAIVRSCLLRAGGNISKGAAICAYIRPDLLGTKNRVLFVRTPEDIGLQEQEQRAKRVKEETVKVEQERATGPPQNTILSQQSS
ncbi:hypothetical protein KIPB_004562 [Kipferlia bialata]|uniref:Uncharacterized protein n=1 Tax=Kipferlia bialata TaxID=797122 RepID=A0A9K3CX44_9EUKA|nr:hypothetical protein KIPB_004562 [Kipferlia bialata]|eukprot:g4562.t1